MEGFKNVLTWLYGNWSIFIICAGLCLALYQQFKKWQELTTNEKISLAKRQLQETILKYISDAEFEYSEISKSGSLKRSKVISQIYEDYPILSEVVNQENLVIWIDDLIDSALPTLRNIIETSCED